ncbi:hypothetical protein ABH920_007728 [Catenulispora sp. EB89]|uniref:hypothetical protein n=1 Tax=Catenulispora sp. EB89 TaxID=3156257 RepID=UPI0035185E39
MHDHGQEHQREREQEHEQEHYGAEDIEHWLAAAAPEEVPVLVDLHHRARALGRRRRTHRRALAAGGVGVTTAAVVTAVLVVGHAGPATAPGPATTTQTSTAPTNLMPSKPLPEIMGSPLEDDRPAAQAAVKAFEAALPAGSTLKYAKAYVGNPAVGPVPESVFGIMLDVVEPSGRAYNLQVDVGQNPFKADWDCDKPIQCGDARFLGLAAQWQSSRASAPTWDGEFDTVFTIRDLTSTHYNFGFRADNKDLSKLPDPQELRTIGLNEKLGAALVAAFKQVP